MSSVDPLSHLLLFHQNCTLQLGHLARSLEDIYYKLCLATLWHPKSGPYDEKHHCHNIQSFCWGQAESSTLEVLIARNRKQFKLVSKGTSPEGFWISQWSDLMIAGAKWLPEGPRAGNRMEHFPIGKDSLMNMTC